MPLSIDDLIRDLGAETSASSTLELGMDDVRAINESFQDSPEQKVMDLVAAARRNSTVTNLSLTVDEELADSFFPAVNYLLRDLSRATELHVTFCGSSNEIGDVTRILSATLHLGTAAMFLRRCLQGVTHLTSLTVLVPDSTLATQIEGEGQPFDWSFLGQLMGLQSFVFHCGDGCVVMELSAVMRALSILKHLERIIIRGFSFQSYMMAPCDAELVKELLERRSLITLHLEHVILPDETLLPCFTLGLRRSAVENLHLSYLCRRDEESSLIMTAIAECTALRILHLVGHPDHVPDRFFPPLVGGATILHLNVRLTRFTLTNYSISDDEALSISSELLRPNCVLEYLNLSGCHMSHLSMGNLLASQTAHTCMKDLRICRSTEIYPSVEVLRNPSQGLDEPMLDHVEKALRGLADVPLRSLRVVDLGFRPYFYHQEARAVVQCLSGNYHLETVEIQYLDDECRELVDSLGRLNAAGRRYLKSCRSREAGVELLGKVSSHITDVFVHLCENPSLCVL